jgi:outer membrane protein assembly factor BamB
MPPARRLAALILLTSLVAHPVAAQDTEALFAAVQQSDLAAVEAALDAGADVNGVNRYGSTPLFFAADRGDLAIARLLLERGADPNIRDTFYGATPLGWAAGKHPDIAIMLLGYGAEGIEQVLSSALRNDDPETAVRAIAVARLPRPLFERATEVARERGYEAVTAALADAEVYDPEPPPPFVFDSAELPRYEGMYRDEQAGAIVEVARRGDQLVASVDGNETVLTAAGPNRFTSPDGAVMAFGGRGGVIESAQFMAGELRYGLRPVDPEEAELIRAGGAAPAAAAADYSADPVTMRPGWPAFRGHDGSGNGDGKGVPSEWDVESGAGVRWKTPVAGIANSSPIAWGDRIFVTSAVSAEGDDTVRIGLYGDVAPVDDLSEHRFFLTCIDRATGAVVWERDVYVGAPAVKRHTKSSQANSTPVTDGNVVVVLFGSVGVLAAYDFEGNELWQTDVGVLDSGWFYDPDYQWGHAASPVLYEDMVIVQADVQQNSFIAAYDLADGSERWRTARDEIPSWSTPVVYRGQPRDELVTNAKTIRSYDPRTGEELWRLGPNSEVVVGSPVVGDGIVYVLAGYPPIRPIYAVRPGGDGDISLPRVGETSEDILWSKDRGGTYIPTPLLYRGILYTNANNGRLTAYDASSGEMLYRARIAGIGTSYVGSPIAADGRLYFSTEDGNVHVVRAGPEYELLASNEMGEVIWATPAVTDGLLVVRTLHHVWGLEE